MARRGLAFDIALHAGTLAAVMLYFSAIGSRSSAQGFGLQRRRRSRNARAIADCCGCWRSAPFPAGVAGFLFQKKVENVRPRQSLRDRRRCAIVIGMRHVDRRERGPQAEGYWARLAADAMLIGIAQALALIPGVSRSGITISAGLFRNLERRGRRSIFFSALDARPSPAPRSRNFGILSQARRRHTARHADAHSGGNAGQRHHRLLRHPVLPGLPAPAVFGACSCGTASFLA